MAEETKGASNNERLLAAARSDNEELILEVFDDGGFDINCQDGLGNTALHIAVQHGSTDVLEHILSYEDCDVDPQNYIDKATPLHIAVQIEHAALRTHVIDSLLEAGANTYIKNKNGETALDLIRPDDLETAKLIRKARTPNTISRDEIASDGEGGSGSGSDDE